MKKRTGSSILVFALGIALLLGSPALASQAVTEERLRGAFGEARSAVEASLEAELDASLELRFVDAAEIAERIAA